MTLLIPAKYDMVSFDIHGDTAYKANPSLLSKTKEYKACLVCLFRKIFILLAA